MDSPSARGVYDSPYLRAQEANQGSSSSFSLGPGMHESGGGDFDPASAPDTPQSTADLTAFVQNLLQQMASRFHSMSDAILLRIDEMASRIEDLERSVEDVLREVTGTEDDPGALPSPSSSPIRRAMVAPASPDVRKSFPAVSPLINRYSSVGSMSLQKTGSLNSPRQSSSSSLNVPNSPDRRRHSSSNLLFGPGSPDPRRTVSGSFSNIPIPSSPDARRRLEPSYSSGTHLR